MRNYSLWTFYQFRPVYILKTSYGFESARLGLLVAFLGTGVAAPVVAQTFATLHNFLGGGDGAKPAAGLTVSSNVLYGTTGAGSPGTIFSVHTDGSGFRTLHNFQGGLTNNDGSYPYSGLTLSGDTLYSTTQSGGSAGGGTVFSLKTDGSGFTVLHSFPGFSYPPGINSGGAGSDCRLLLSGDILYGMTAVGGSAGGGTLFSLKTNGSGFTVLHNFDSQTDENGPTDGLILSGDILYGTTGLFGGGTVFSLRTDGTGFAKLHSFTGGEEDGDSPSAGLILASNTLYGTARFGGTWQNGVVFAVRIDGTLFSILHSFAATSYNSAGIQTNSEGANPFGGLILSGDTLYGTAAGAGSAGGGTVFSLKTDGSAFKVVYNFPGVGPGILGTTNTLYASTNSQGTWPHTGVILSGNALYGTATEGGTSGLGTVFAIPLLPQLEIIPAGRNVVLTWPTNSNGLDYFVGYTLQSTTNLASAIWTTNLSAPIVVDGHYTVTSPIAGAHQFFRLSQ